MFEAVGAAPFSFYPEICEDLWTPTPPSARAKSLRIRAVLATGSPGVTRGTAAATRTKPWA
jgi:hypothetical protein